MRDVKSFLLIVVVLVLIAAAGYLTYMISNGEDPLVIFGSRATGQERNLNDDAALLAAGGTQVTSPSPSTSPILPVQSPTLSITSTISPSTVPTSTPSVTPSPTIPISLPPLPSGPISPTVAPELPVAGSMDYLIPLAIPILLLGLAFAL